MISNTQFVDALFRDMRQDCAATIQSFTGDPAKDGQWGSQPVRHGKRLPSMNPFANNYVCVSSFYATPEGKFYRRKILFHAMHAVMIDDLGTKLPMEDLKLDPSALIETSPGNFQAWLFLEKPITSLSEAETLVNQMIEKGISAEMDPGMKGVTRVARLPEGGNGKMKYRGPKDEVWLHKVHTDAAALERRYSPAQIAAAYGLDLSPRAELPPREPPRTGIDIERATVAKWLRIFGHHIAELRPGYHSIICPWIDDHSDKGETGTYYMEPEALNSFHGGFVCNHGHCMDKDISSLVGWIRAKKDEVRAARSACDIEHIYNYVERSGK